LQAYALLARSVLEGRVARQRAGFDRLVQRLQEPAAEHRL
jgi:hypothetical protein